MHRSVSLVAFALLAGVAAGACSSSTSPSKNTDPNTLVFRALLLPQNEAPTPVASPNADATGSGQFTLTLHVTRDSAGNITTATADYLAVLANFPANTPITGAHIHKNIAGQTAGVLVAPQYTSGELVLTNGSGTLDKKGQAILPEVAQGIINDPAGHYFNVHTQLNQGGAARGQLTKDAS